MLLIIMLITVLFSSCSVTNVLYTGSYKIKLNQVAIEKNHKISMQDVYTNCYFEDSVVSIMWNITDNEFGFTLLNQSDNTIKVLWDDAIFVDELNNSVKVVHKDIAYDERNNPQTSYSIYKHSFLTNYIIPAKNIKKDITDKQLPLFFNNSYNYNELLNKSKMIVGRNFEIVLPIQMNNVIYYYTFIFDIKNFMVCDKKSVTTNRYNNVLYSK